jgi:hypothetical protein
MLTLFSTTKLRNLSCSLTLSSLVLICQLPTPELSIQFSAANCQLSRCHLISVAFAKLDCPLTALMWNSGTRLTSNSCCLRSSLCSLGAPPPPEYTDYSVVACWFAAAKICLLHCYLATRAARATDNTALLLSAFGSRGNVFSELLSRNELFHLSGVMSQYVYTF